MKNIKDFDELETEYVEGAKKVLDEHIKSSSFEFLGLLYRGAVVKRGRSHSFAVSLEEAKNLGDDPLGTVSQVVKFYLEHYGYGTSFGNLILEAESGQDDQADTIVVSVGVESESNIVMDTGNRSRKITLSKGLVNALGWSLNDWSEVFTEIQTCKVADDNKVAIAFASASRRLRKMEENPSSAGNLNFALAYVVWKEPGFAHDFGKYIMEGNDDDPVATLDTMRIWLRAVQGLFLLLHKFGPYWITYRFIPPTAAILEDLDFPIPEKSAITGISNALPNSEVLRKIANTLKKFTSNLVSHNSSFSVAVTRARSDAKTELEQEFLSDEEIEIQLPTDAIPNLHLLLELAKKLRGKKHEGHPLEFILLCAPEARLLHYHRNAANRPWVIQQQAMLDTRDFPIIANVSWEPLPLFKEKEARNLLLSTLTFSIEANALVLQESGIALYFPPIGCHIPNSIVQFDPFDNKCRDQLLEQFTKNDCASIAIHVRQQDVRLFYKGAKIARFDGKSWKHLAHSLGGTKGSEPLKEKILNLWSDLNEQENYNIIVERIATVSDLVLHVAERGHGALVFLNRNDKGEPDKSIMAPVWGSADGNHRVIEGAKPEILAAFAGLDGETYVEVLNGSYATRQYLIIPSDNFVPIFAESDKRTFSVGPELEPDWKSEKALELFRFGTRHQKALRITYAYPESTLAITVSSDGSIRLWQAGNVLHEYEL